MVEIDFILISCFVVRLEVITRSRLLQSRATLSSLMENEWLMWTLRQVSGLDMRQGDRETETGQKCRQQMNKMYNMPYCVIIYTATTHQISPLGIFVSLLFSNFKPRSDFSPAGKIFLWRTEKQIWLVSFQLPYNDPVCVLPPLPVSQWGSTVL